MKTSQIVKIAILAEGRLGVFPDTPDPDYQYIYREAAGVYWDSDLECFKSTPPHDWGYAEWYTHIISLVRSSAGLNMLLSPSTIYDSDQEGFASLIQAADAGLER